VVDQSPIAGTPFSENCRSLFYFSVISFDDGGIPAASYPNLPAYPVGQREVTVLQTGKAPYAWSAATTNFVKPAKENLVVYELLVRDFDANRSYKT
jgi:hypothetical protein